MKGYRLVEYSTEFKKIMRGKIEIGRVCRHADGNYLGVIGNGMIKKATEQEAYEGIIAKQLGYQNASQMKSYQRITRADQRESKNRAKHNKQQRDPLPENFEPVDLLVGLPTRKRFNPNSEAR